MNIDLKSQFSPNETVPTSQNQVEHDVATEAEPNIGQNQSNHNTSGEVNPTDQRESSNYEQPSNQNEPAYQEQAQQQVNQREPRGEFDNRDQSGQYADYFQDIIKPRPEEVIYDWHAASRPFKKRNRQYHTTIITISLLLSLILFFAGQVVTIAVVIAVAFLAYIMSTIPPHPIKNKFTTYGIRSEDNLYYWEELGRYWFSEKHGEKVLHVEVARFPHRLALLLGKSNEEMISEILSEVLLQQKPSLTPTEKFTEWLKRKVPLDLDS